MATPMATRATPTKWPDWRPEQLSVATEVVGAMALGETEGYPDGYPGGRVPVV